MEITIEIKDYGDSDDNRIIFINGTDRTSCKANFTLVNILYDMLKTKQTDSISLPDYDITRYDVSESKAHLLKFILASGSRDTE